MTAVNGFPLMLNQEVPLGHGYAAEAFRAEHYSATSGGNGVGSPTALKVHAQPAPDGTIRTNPGGATLRSTYAGQDEQSYHAYFAPRTVPVSPTGSAAGGRTDLVVVQLCDPEHDDHWSYEGEYPIPAEIAKGMDFQRIHVFEGLDRAASLDFPHALLAEINRPPNTTIVAPEHITDLRELANPKTDSIVITDQHGTSAPGDMGENNGWWFTAFTQHIVVPEWCNQFIIQAQAAGMYWTGGYGFGDFSINMAGLSSNDNPVRWRFSGADSQGSVDTNTTAEYSFPPSGRGRPREVNYRFRNNTSSADGSRIRPTSTTRFTLNVTFLQVTE